MADNPVTRVEHELHVHKSGVESMRLAEHVAVSFGDGLAGEIHVEMCVDCGYVKARCSHQSFTWNEDNTKLTYDLCGRDGT